MNEVNTTEINDDTVTNNNEEKMDYKYVVDMIREMDSTVKNIEETMKNTVKDKGFNEELLYDIIKYSKKDIQEKDLSELTEFVKKYADGEINEETLRDDLLLIKSANLLYLSMDDERNNIKKEAKSIFDEYFNFLNSNRVEHSRKKELEVLKQAIELEDDEIKKIQTKRKIKLIEDTFSFNFLFERFENEKLRKKEIERILDGFFKDRIGVYTIERFEKKMKKFGFGNVLYKYFLNLEENFLEEEYHPYNNLFLYFYMRIISHLDPYNSDDKLRASVLTGAIANLVYHRFKDTESENDFKKVMMRLINIFRDSKENREVMDNFFKDNNTTYEKNKERIAQEEETKKKNKEYIIKKMKNYGMEIDESKDVDELSSELKEYINKLKEEQLEKYKEEMDEVTKVEKLVPKETDEIKMENSYKTFEQKADDIHSAVQRTLEEMSDSENKEDIDEWQIFSI